MSLQRQTASFCIRQFDILAPILSARKGTPVFGPTPEPRNKWKSKETNYGLRLLNHPSLLRGQPLCLDDLSIAGQFLLDPLAEFWPGEELDRSSYRGRVLDQGLILERFFRRLG